MLVLFVGGADNHVQTAQTDQSVNNARKSAHVAEQKGNKVEVKDADKSPVKGTDDDKDKGNHA